MELKIKKKAQYEATFYWDGDTDKMWIKLVVPTVEEVKAINEECTKSVVDFQPNPRKGNRMERIDSSIVDEDKRSDMILDVTLVEWGNFDVNGKKLDCTLENKKFLIEQAEGFSEFYVQSSMTLTADYVKRFGSKSEAKN